MEFGASGCFSEKKIDVYRFGFLWFFKYSFWFRAIEIETEPELLETEPFAHQTLQIDTPSSTPIILKELSFTVDIRRQTNPSFYTASSLEASFVCHPLRGVCNDTANRATDGHSCCYCGYQFCDGYQNEFIYHENDRYVESILYSDCVNPYSVNLLLAGYDKETGPSLYYIDYIATLHKIDKGAFGYGSYFSLAMMDRHYRSGMSVEEAVDLADKCIIEIRSRLVVAPPNFVIKIVDSNGARTFAWRESIKDVSVPATIVDVSVPATA
ncbi:hypothetical protein GIB67_033562 [Kingdonia uniflora]|uniref:Uncharacterized protein n=1 Tax=Kingdonia uniflora TaxID=39325 RepID=A0A7J7L6H0_9MAGN|nr:hypothetical protein GIB67_033562 [Kingdonia uniflora]